MEENKAMEVEVTEEESLMEKIKSNKKVILKKGLMVAGSVVGIMVAYKLMKANKNQKNDDLTVDTEISGDGEVTTEIEVSENNKMEK